MQWLAKEWFENFSNDVPAEFSFTTRLSYKKRTCMRSHTAQFSRLLVFASCILKKKILLNEYFY